MSNTPNDLYEFDKFRLDVSERILWRAGERVPLSEKAFDTLVVLVKRGNHLVSKDDLLTEVWADAIVEENNLDKNISILRKVLGERADKGKFIETVRGHGFRFVPSVQILVSEIQVPAAGRELGVDSVLEGNIQTAGDRIRISARLLRVSDGAHLWAEQFDEKFTDIFAVQDSISERVAAALKIRLGKVQKKRPTKNVEAYQLYMKGRFQMNFE